VSPRPTRLYDLALSLSSVTPHIFLLTATPLQLNELELLDLLRILGLGGTWVHEDAFSRFYHVLGKDPLRRSNEDWLHLFLLISWFANTYLKKDQVAVVVESFFGDKREQASALLNVVSLSAQNEFLNFVRNLSSDDLFVLDRVLRGLSPVSWFMIRNTRDRLRSAGYRFPERIILNHDVSLDEGHPAYRLLIDLNEYLTDYYDQYMSFLKGEGRRGFGLIRSVYYQRFVSSFAAAFHTVRRRRESLEALLRGDEQRLLDLASEMLEGIDEDVDEEDLVDMMREAIERARGLVESEVEKLKELESKLVGYSSATIGSEDPKLREVRRVIGDLLSEGRKVLVFSKFTDTVDIIRDFISPWLGADRVGTYTGRGGEIWDSESRAWRSCEKEDVRRALEGKIDVLVCSDAASEGLNLQAASGVVNVDMPWNPAKVEQRIGRADRIGQIAENVRVVNVWYPETYEAKMYRVLFDRRQIWWVIVGPASGIIAQRLVEAFGRGESGLRLQRYVEETVEQIERSKDDAVRLSRIFPEELPLKPTFVEVEVGQVLERFVVLACKALGLDLARRFVRDNEFLFVESLGRLPEGVRRFVQGGLCLQPGRPNALVPGHPFVQWLASQVELYADMPDKVPFSAYGVGRDDGLLDIYVMEPSGWPRNVSDAADVVDVFRKIVGLAEGG